MQDKNIREDYRKDLTVILREFFDQKEQELTNTFYVGKVIDNNDPEKLGRCRVRVYGIYSNEISDNELPWALPQMNFIGSLKGSFIVPPNDCIVSVRFDNNNIYEPIYSGKIINTGVI